MSSASARHCVEKEGEDFVWGGRERQGLSL